MLEQLIESMSSNLEYSLSQVYASLSQLNPWVIVFIAVAIAAFIAISIVLGIRAHRQPVSSGREDFIGRTAEVKTVLNPNGTVLMEGELWSATSEGGEVQPGTEVVITRSDRLKLWVIKK